MPETTPTTKRLWGHFEYSFDDKGRLIVPQKFRDALGDKFVLTMGPDHHIRAFTLEAWSAIEERLCQYDMFDELTADVLMIQRLYGSSAEVETDGQGRIIVPRHLRHWAGFKEEIVNAVFIGAGNRAEIWERATWTAYSDSLTLSGVTGAARRQKFPNGGEAAVAETPTVAEPVAS